MPLDISARLDVFKSELGVRSAQSIVRRFVTFGDAFALHDDLHFAVREEVADHFRIHPNDVFVVGSAKLGFSIAPSKRYRPFGDHSDIDIAVISRELFEAVWREVFEFRTTTGFWSDERAFQKYLFRGWIRPDFLPSGPAFARSEQWSQFFTGLTASGRYGQIKIAAGLYRDSYFFEKYHSASVQSCQDELS